MKIQTFVLYYIYDIIMKWLEWLDLTYLQEETVENWVVINKKADFDAIMKKCEVGEVVARCLVNKDLKNIDEIKEFIRPDLKNLHNPLLMRDMEKTITILYSKIKAEKHIRIIGDYDVDGIVSTYILFKTINKLGGNVDYVLPDRIVDGFGLNKNMVENARKDGVDTIMTCDNGIAALAEVDLAKDLGLTVIITDHHDLIFDDKGQIVPRADAIVNPMQDNCEYPFKGLCGAAITYKVALALMEFYKKEEIDNQSNLDQLKDIVDYQEELLAMTALATVCDVMDLIGENRVIVKYGLEYLQRTSNFGITALVDANGITKEGLLVYHLGFVIGPSLNSTGRLDLATKGLELLLTEDKVTADKIAQELKELNDSRKSLTLEGADQAIELIESTSLKDDKILVVYLKDCHESLAGIIAGRIRERYHKPTIVLTKAKEGVKGSARSIDSYNIFEGLMKQEKYLTKYGGHAMAAGMSLEEEKVSDFREALNEDENLTQEMLIPKIKIDGVLPLRYVEEDLVEEMKVLEPFGKGNSRPIFAKRDLDIISLNILGKNKNVLKFKLGNSYDKVIDAIYFGDIEKFFAYMADKYGIEEAENMRNGRKTEVKLTITYHPTINEFNNRRTLQLVIENFR